jgi:hypothetical protein
MLKNICASKMDSLFLSHFENNLDILNSNSLEKKEQT